MKKRLLSLLLSLTMLVSLISGLSLLPVQAATVDYVTSGSYVYNWGVRETVATFLSPMAEDFYADNNITYEDLAALSGSSSTGDVPYSTLYQKLHELMYSNLTNPTSYAGTRDLYRYTDCQNSANTSSSISSFYSGDSIGPDWDSGSTWNREHVWPNSRSTSGSSYTDREEDIMMLRPTSVKENSSRSNTPYGEGSSYYDPNEESGGTHNLRGDVSRVILYVYTCWGGSDQHDGAYDYLWGSSGVMESKDVLLRWMEEDPVDTWELGRNDSVESITGTRNVFVDYPELAFALFNEDVPTDYESPSGGATVSYAITACSSNTNYGTVSVSGKTITATPKTGYAVSGYTILSGTATVNQNGNVFTVLPTSDVSIRINFAQRAEVTVQFAQSGSVATSQNAYVGDSITLPAHSGTVPSGQTFLGWCASEVTETTTKPTYYAPGATWYVDAAVTLYALYARSEEGGVVNSDTYEPYSGTITEGDYVIVYNKDNYANQAMIAEDTGGTRLNFTDIIYTDGSVDTPDERAVWHIASNGTCWTLYNEATDTYAGGTGTKNQAKPLSSVTDYALWSVSGTDTYEFVNKGNAAKSINANLRRNANYGFACYSTSTGGALTLYKRQSGTTYYFTAAKQECAQHTYDNACDAVCNVCGATRTPADHVYTSRVTTAATCGAEGVRTYTCSVCGDNYTEAIAATGAHTYDNACDTACNGCGAVRTITHVYVAVVTTAATCGAEGVRTYTCSVCGDNYTEAIAATGNHTYDNACDADCNACGTARTPADHVYSADCDVTCNVCGAERTLIAGGEKTITFDDDKIQRVEFSTTSQVWQNGDLIVTNNKGSASSSVADYSNPVRFYQGSQIIIAYPGMTGLVISAPNGTYGDPWAATLDAAGLKYESDGGVYTVTFATPVDSVTLIASKQIRANSITAVGAETVAEHTYDNDMDVDCNACGDIRTVVYDLFTFGGFSVSEDVNGLAFRYTVQAAGITVTDYYGDYTNATIAPNSALSNAKLVMMGAVVSNDSTAVPELSSVNNKTVIDIKALKFFESDGSSVTYAVRVLDIPDSSKDALIYARPYYIYVDADGNEIECYGETQSASYNSVI